MGLRKIPMYDSFNKNIFESDQLSVYLWLETRSNLKIVIPKKYKDEQIKQEFRDLIKTNPQPTSMYQAYVRNGEFFILNNLAPENTFKKKKNLN